MLRLKLNNKVTIMTHNKPPDNGRKALDKTPETIHKMFNLVSSKYDFVNNAMSFGTHNYVKYFCIKSLNIKPYSNILDLCCGTGDLAGLAKKIQPLANVTGIDFSEKMLEIAKEKYQGKQIQFFQGDVTNLPYDDNSIDIITMGFGLRNICNAEKAVQEVYRVLKPNGSFLHIDFGKKNIASKIYDILTPVLIRFLTDNAEAYSYLIKSKEMFPEPEDLIKDFESKGFKLKQRRDYLFSVISSQIMTK